MKHASAVVVVVAARRARVQQHAATAAQRRSDADARGRSDRPEEVAVVRVQTNKVGHVGQIEMHDRHVARVEPVMRETAPKRREDVEKLLHGRVRRRGGVDGLGGGQTGEVNEPAGERLGVRDGRYVGATGSSATSSTSSSSLSSRSSMARKRSGRGGRDLSGFKKVPVRV